MTAASIPVTHATRRAWSPGTGDFSVSELHFSPGLELAEHHHKHACVATLRAELPSSSLAKMPPRELHSDTFGDQGAGVVVIEIDQDVPERKNALEPRMRFLVGIVEYRSPRIDAFSRRLSNELGDPDEL